MSDFTSGVVDIGIAVRDAARSVAFYRDALGFEEVSQFEVPAALGADAGLSDDRAFSARVMRLAGAEGGTRIKLVEFRGAPRCCDTRFVHSVIGLRYLTVRVADVDAAAERARAAGAGPAAKGPVDLPPPFKAGQGIAVVRDPDDNLIELIGPRGSAGGA